MILTQKDLRVAVALTNPLPYSQRDDQIFSDFQNSNYSGLDDCSSYELAARRRYGRPRAHGQSCAPRRLRRFGGASPAGVAETLGRQYFSGPCPLRDRHRDRAAPHAAGANRVIRGYRSQSFGRGARPHILPFILDTTSTLRRRFPCVA